MSETNRNQSMIVQVNLDVMTPEQIETLLQDIIDSNGLNCDCITKDIYVFDEKKKDEMLTIMKNGGAVCSQGFPERYTETNTKGGIVTKDGKKYKELTAENLKDSKKYIKSEELSKLMPVEKEIVEKIIEVVKSK